MSKAHHKQQQPAGKQVTGDGSIPESAAQQLERLLKESPYFIDSMTAYRNATADIVVELLRGVLANHPEELLRAMEDLQNLKLPGADGTIPFPERAELVGMIQERLQPGMHQGSKKKR
ncbi:MAG TPA: hypothetical protein VH105_06070 [Burkholderiales bacterium]|jgi:hypothetical protein|nr:hypothetical protein [Burkholderiales bacterium]